MDLDLEGFGQVTVDTRDIGRLTRVQEAHPVQAVGQPGTGLMAQGGPGAATGIVSAQMLPVRRDHAHIMRATKIMAAMAGDRFYYSWQVKDHQTGKMTTVEGPSIKAAMEIARIYGNCRVVPRAFDQGPFWLIYAQFLDLESGYTLERAFIQAKAQTTFKTKNADRQQQMAFAIGQSKALRNVVVNALPTLADFAVQEAKSSLIDRIGRNLDTARARLIHRLDDMGIPHARVERLVGRKIGDMLAPDIARVVAELSAISDGMASIDDLYPDPNAAPPSGEPTRAQVAANNPPPAGEATPPANQQEQPPAGPQEPPPAPAPAAAPSEEPTDFNPELEIPPGYDNPAGPNWAVWADMILGSIIDYQDVAGLDEFMRANGRHLVRLRQTDAAQARAIAQAAEARRAQLGGAE